MPFKRLYSRRLLVGLILALFDFAISPQPAAAQPASLTPSQIKVGYLYNFANYTVWPKEAFADANAPFVFGILGQDPFGEDLNFLKPKTVKQPWPPPPREVNRKVVVKPFRKVEEVRDCHLLFISASEKNKLPEILKTLENTSILTVSEMDGFLQQNGMVNFYVAPLEGSTAVGTIRFEINQRAVEKAGLRIHPYVLKLARNRK